MSTSLPGHSTEDAGERLSILGRVTAGGKRELFQSRRHYADPGGVVERVLHGEAVVIVGHLAGPSAANVQLLIPTDHHSRVVGQDRLDGHNVGQIPQAVGGENHLRFREVPLDNRIRGKDDHLLADVDDLELKGKIDRRGKVHQHSYAFCRDGLMADRVDGDIMFPDRNVDDEILPVLVRTCRQIRPPNLDRSPHNRFICPGVVYFPGYLAAHTCLQLRYHQQKKEDKREQEQRQGLSTQGDSSSCICCLFVSSSDSDFGSHMHSYFVIGLCSEYLM